MLKETFGRAKELRHEIDEVLKTADYLGKDHRPCEDITALRLCVNDRFGGFRNLDLNFSLFDEADKDKVIAAIWTALDSVRCDFEQEFANL